MLFGLEHSAKHTSALGYHLFNYAKAFYSVVHTKLLEKLAQYGVNDLLLI